MRSRGHLLALNPEEGLLDTNKGRFECCVCGYRSTFLRLGKTHIALRDSRIVHCVEASSEFSHACGALYGIMTNAVMMSHAAHARHMPHTSHAATWCVHTPSPRACHTSATGLCTCAWGVARLTWPQHSAQSKQRALRRWELTFTFGALNGVVTQLQRTTTS